MSSPLGWNDVVSQISNPDVFLNWIQDAIRINKVTKLFVCAFNGPGGIAVVMDTDGRVIPYDIDNITHNDRYVGITETGNTIDHVTRVVTHGVMYVPGAGWIKGSPYYIGANSYLTPTAPVSGTVRPVGVAVDTDRLLVMSSFGGTGGGGGDENIDGGFANSVYLVTQNVDGGGA